MYILYCNVTHLLICLVILLYCPIIITFHVIESVVYFAHNLGLWWERGWGGGGVHLTDSCCIAYSLSSIQSRLLLAGPKVFSQWLMFHDRLSGAIQW